MNTEVSEVFACFLTQNNLAHSTMSTDQFLCKWKTKMAILSDVKGLFLVCYGWHDATAVKENMIMLISCFDTKDWNNFYKVVALWFVRECSTAFLCITFLNVYCIQIFTTFLKDLVIAQYADFVDSVQEQGKLQINMYTSVWSSPAETGCNTPTVQKKTSPPVQSGRHVLNLPKRLSQWLALCLIGPDL